MDKLLQKVRETIEKHDMIKENTRVLVALSGGADSVTLLLVLRELGVTVSACHLNHCLRGEESDRDEMFCRDLCRRLDIPLIVQKSDAAAYAQMVHESLETASRDLRYTFFARAAEQIRAEKVATAHTASDNLETILFHLTRGTGLDGLCGIPPVRNDIIRPLIACTREDVETFLARRGQRFVVDSTNLSADYTRNQIRHAVIPVLTGINSRAEQNAADLSARLRDETNFLNLHADNLLQEAYNKNGWDVAQFKAAHSALRKRAIRRMCEHENIPMRDFTARHIALIENLIFSEKPSARIHLPAGVVVYREYDLLKIDTCKTEQKPLYDDLSVQIPFSGTLGNGFALVTIKRMKKDKHFYKSFNTFYVDCDTIDVPTLVLRTRRTGDKLHLHSGSKTLKKLFIDRKIPRDKRDRLTVVADQHGVIAVQSVDVDLSRYPKDGDLFEIRFEG